MAERHKEMTTRGEQRDWPFSRMFDDLFGRHWGKSPWRSELEAWAPDVEVFHRNNDLVVRADLPGLSRDDITIDVADDHVTLRGERKREREEQSGLMYRSERSYGSFYRVIPLPEGAMSDQARADFTNGVLEITMPSPPEQVRRGRRLEIGTRDANAAPVPPVAPTSMPPA